MFFESFIFFIISFLFGASTLVIGARNPIHSILILILVFFLGSILLFLLSMEYFAILFLIVYVGAIVVLFLFIVMMLEIKMVNSSERFSDLFSFKNIILAFLVLEILFFSNEEFWDITPVFQTDTKLNWNIIEINLYTDYSKVLHYIGQLKAIGGILFSHYLIAIILISILLFISMFGSIVMTLESTKRVLIKQQDATLQGFRNSTSVSMVKGLNHWAVVVGAGTPANTGGIISLMQDYPVTTLAAGVGIGVLIMWGVPLLVPYIAPIVTKTIGTLFGGAVVGAGAGAPFMPSPQGFGKTVEHLGSAVVPQTTVLNDLAEAAGTAVAGALAQAAVQLVSDALTQTEVTSVVSTSVQTEVPSVVVGVTQTEASPLVDGVAQTEIPSTSPTDASMQTEPIPGTDKAVQTHEEIVPLMQHEHAVTRITELEHLVERVTAHASFGMRNLADLITGRSARVPTNTVKDIVDWSVAKTLEELSLLLAQKASLDPTSRAAILAQAKRSATRSSVHALGLQRESYTHDVNAILIDYNKWFAEPEGAAIAAIAKAVRNVGALPGKSDCAIAQPATGFYPEAPAGGGAGGPPSAPLRGHALNNFLTESHLRNASTVPEEVHTKMRAAFQSVLEHIISIKKIKTEDASSIELLPPADAEAIEETIREVFMIIMYHFY